MSSYIYLQRGDDLTVNPTLGFGLLGFGGGNVSISLVIQAEKPFLYYNKRLLNALNSGSISQAVYQAIINEQNEARQVYLFDANIDIDKQTLIDLARNYNVPNIDEGGTAAEIVEDIILENYQIVKKV